MTTPQATTISPRAHDENRSIAGLSIGQYLIRRLHDYGVRHVFGIPGDYVLAFLQNAERKPDPDDQLHARRLRRLCRRCLRPREWHGGGLRDVLRGRIELVQFDRRGVRGEIAGRRDQRRAGFGRADQQSAVAPQGARFSHAGRGVRKNLRRRGRTGRSERGVPRDRSRARCRRPAQAAGLFWNCRATW